MYHVRQRRGEGRNLLEDVLLRRMRRDVFGRVLLDDFVFTRQLEKQRALVNQLWNSERMSLYSCMGLAGGHDEGTELPGFLFLPRQVLAERSVSDTLAAGRRERWVSILSLQNTEVVG